MSPSFAERSKRATTPCEPGTIRLLEELSRDEADSQLNRTEIAQPAIFAMQVALAELWKSWGVCPVAVTGHSVGEVAAACIAGVFSLEDAARIIVLRARFMDACARGEGTMLAVGLDEDQAKAIAVPHDEVVTIAAFNGPRSLTLSGPRISLEAIARDLEQRSIFARLVRVDHPFHHALMQPAAEALEKALADLAPRQETIPFFSTVTGGRQSGSGVRLRPLGSRNKTTRPLRLGGQRPGGVRRRCLAGTQRASRAPDLDSGMPCGSWRQAPGHRVGTART